jgi:pimeloyl-ACP methyl ester carboxylesterase
MSTPISRYIKPGYLRFHVMDWGGVGKPPLLLLHGLASSCRMFDLIAPRLAADYHVYALDQRGHGLSDQPDQGYDFETIAGDVDRLVDALGYAGVPLVVAGHSWGAYTALYYTATRPDRAAQTVLLDGGIRPIGDSYPTWAEAEIGMAPPVYINRTVDDIRRMIQADWLGAAFRPELQMLALSIFDLSDLADVRAHLKRTNHVQIAHALWAFQPADYYAQIQCPTLIVNAVSGAEIDPQMASYAQQAEAAISQARVVWMRDTIHDIPWHRPVELTEIMRRFLSP